ncbi:hypothetical protein OKA04_19035 [Luteolibacter flavescens]|uniref:Uncharacterized protein n=1 Tax=Luteolibacter flavescens TaxID=1859460 RepID=A0ABT3FTD8_9BACT|nr:hypothetical protein [Luteolibacter flavescens]MCW1886843.1 hypothetical protein [Luteolibacter flavescens]
MSENPYQAPASSLLELSPTTVPVSEAELRRLLRIAQSQRWVLLCSLTQAVLYFISSTVPWASVEFIWVTVLIVSLCCIVQLVNRLRGWVAALIVGLFATIPGVGMVVLFTAGASAAWVLRRSGFRIGWLGVSPREIKDAIDAQLHAPFPASTVPAP